MGEIELEKYLKNISQHYIRKFRYDPINMLKRVVVRIYGESLLVRNR